MLKRSNRVDSLSVIRLGDSIPRSSTDEKEGVFPIMLSMLKVLQRTFVAIEIRMPSQLGSTKVHGQQVQKRIREQQRGLIASQKPSLVNRVRRNGCIIKHFL